MPKKEDLIRIAKLAGAKVKEMRENNEFVEDMKYGVELVTTADLAANDIIKSEIKRLFPDHQILSEEDGLWDEKNEAGVFCKGAIDFSKPLWTIDPIDGTVNYANGHYQVAVSIGYSDQNKTLMGVVYNPFLEEVFFAEYGKGATLNDTPIKVKPVDTLAATLTATGFPYKRETVPYISRLIEAVLPKVRDIRRGGSAALDLCWVACGRLQAYYEGELKPWDISAGKLIATEAGARNGHYREKKETEAFRSSGVPDFLDGDRILFSSPAVFEELLETLLSVK